MSHTPRVIAIVGMPGAGKSLASAFFRDHEVPVLRFGDQTDSGLREAGLEKNEKNERIYREQIRRELGMAAMAIKIEPRVQEALQKHELVVLDGLYSWEEFVYLQKKFTGIKLLCIWAPKEMRYTRLKHRNDRPLTLEEAESRDIAEITNLHKGGPIAYADLLIENNGSKEDLCIKLEHLLHLDE